MLKKLFKILVFLMLFIAIGFGILYYLYDKPLPTGESGPEADALAYRMLDALSYKNFNNTKIIEWSFRGNHSYKWNREKAIVKVSWKDNVVELDLITPHSSKAYVNNETVSYETS